MLKLISRTYETPDLNPLKRIIIVGNCSSGKTRLAINISEILNIAHFELDNFRWKPNWQKAPIEEYKEKSIKAASLESWVMDGNCDGIKEQIFTRATTMIWLNYPLYYVFFRALKRTIKRVITKERFFANNYETFKHAFLCSESVLLQILQKHSKRRKEYSNIKNLYPNLIMIELKSHRESILFLNNLRSHLK